MYIQKTSRLVIALCLAIFGGGQVAKAQTFDHHGITVKTKGVKLTLGGRFHLDTVSVFDDVTPFRDKTDVRRLRVYAALVLGRDWRFKFDSDVGGISTGLKNVWGSYSGIKHTTIKIGNFVAPVLGENMKSSNTLKLMERSLASTLAPGYLFGGGVTYRGEKVTLSIGYFGNALNGNPKRPVDDGQSFVSRIVWAPVHERKKSLFIAASLENRQLGTGARSRVRAIPEFGLLRTRLIDTLNLRGVKSYTNFVGETGFGYGPFMIKGQYVSRSNRAPALGDPTFVGASIESAFVLTGENQQFGSGSGTYGGIHPKSRYGAVEITGRISMLDLEDGLVMGGKETNYAIGLNWYVNRNLRLMSNYVHAKTRPGANGLRESPDAILGRLQIAF